MKSTFLSLRQLDTLQRIGDFMLPGASNMPSFSETDSLSFVDEILSETPEPDVKDFAMLLSVLAFMPGSVIAWLVKLAQRADKFPGLLGGQLRLLDLGLRGVIFSLYYSGKTGAQAKSASPLQAIGFELVCLTEPSPKNTLHENNL
jgi:hypothetical protein